MLVHNHNELSVSSVKQGPYYNVTLFNRYGRPFHTATYPVVSAVNAPELIPAAFTVAQLRGEIEQGAVIPFSPVGAVELLGQAADSLYSEWKALNPDRYEV